MIKVTGNYDDFAIIPENERIPELEDKVAMYLDKIHKLPYNSVKYERVVAPDLEGDDLTSWRKEEIRRCKEGYGGMNAKMYFWFHYVYILNLESGRIVPQYRVADHHFFDYLQEAKAERMGNITVKRRRAGFSWKMAADALHDAMFRKHTTVGMNSKSERDSIELFKKVKFIYDNLPDWMRATSTAGNARMHMDFSYYTKDDKGNRIKRGTQSNIVVVSPTDSAFEGWMLNKWICDEAGKIGNLKQMWSYTEDTMMQELVRLGQPIIFGTAGDITKEGMSFKNMYENAEVYKLKRLFFGGWMGTMVDEFGNDMHEDAIRWVVYERKNRENLSDKEQIDFLQRYPLTVNEAFSMSEHGGVGNQILINRQIQNLEENPPKKTTGYFRMKDDGTVKFIPSSKGKVIIYEHPVEGLTNLYLAGCDPADHDDPETNTVSDLSLMIKRKRHGLKPPALVCEYTDRPQKLNEYFDQAHMALMYYNNCKVLVERNRYRFVQHFTDNGWRSHLAFAPLSMIKATGSGKPTMVGVHMTTDVKEYLEDLIKEDVDNYVDEIPSLELLNEFKVFGAENTDRAIAYGLALILAKEDRSLARQMDQNVNILPKWAYKVQNGKVVRYRKDQQMSEFSEKTQYK